MAIRIWQQAVSDISELSGYADALTDQARRVGSPGTEVVLHGFLPGTYREGLLPLQAATFLWWHHMVVTQMVEAAIEAERTGFDAFASTCFLDPGVDEARSVVDIPVTSALEVALMAASNVGRRFLLITLDQGMASMLRHLVTRYGYSDRVVAILALDPPLTEPEIDPAFRDGRDLTLRIMTQLGPHLTGSVDVIIPAEGVLNSALVKNGVNAIEGVPVLDSFGALLLATEMFVEIRRRTNLFVGRKGTYAKPSNAVIRHVRQVTSTVLKSAISNNSERLDMKDK